ncbi:hypothetical protein ROSA5918_19815 [Roseateles saccharophilus]|uniref:Uncharacterized protein n=1 Tax=Roseateles saccharophilus TaxID=304 RepID=A0A4R3ULX3_ROSSA|nr:hypothetical protein EV671_102161 [Roseateles saccharophilus]
MSRQEIERWNPAEQARAEQMLQSLDHRKYAALSRMSARLAVGSEREQVAARLLMNDTQGAAEIAARSRDAAAYRLALQACGEPRATSSVPACAALTTQAWAALNPQDGRPWLRLMAEAMARRDEPAATLALEQALARPSLSPGRPFVLAFAEARGAAGDPEAQGLALVEIIGREAAQWDPSPFGQSRYCSPAAVEDGARRTNCERLARWLLPRADDLLVAMLASGIADRVGIPATQRPYTREQLQRGQQALVEQSTSDLGMDCASLAHVGEVWPARLLQHNELQQALQAASAPR